MVEAQEKGKLTEEQGEEILEYARRNVENYVKRKEKIDMSDKDYLNNDRGVFVTIKTLKGDLRGCIGRPYPQQSLKKALIDASASATRDPRFPPLSESELENVRIEVTVLTEPEKIEVNSLEQAREKIEMGKHGLIVKGRYGSGLLLPQVPLEHDMDLKEFLDHTCRKAGISKNSWRNPDVQVLRFQGQVFQEDKT